MDLRELKKEVYSLPDIDKVSTDLHEKWLKLFSPAKESSVSVMQHFDSEVRGIINPKVAGFKKCLEKVRAGQMINLKLKHYSQCLIELKLTTLNNDRKKSKLITNSFLNDDFYNFQSTIRDIKYFNADITSLVAQYHEINNILHQELPLEETVRVMEQPHKSIVQTLLDTSERQHLIVRDLGKHFVELARKTKK